MDNQSQPDSSLSSSTTPSNNGEDQNIIPLNPTLPSSTTIIRETKDTSFLLNSAASLTSTTTQDTSSSSLSLLPFSNNSSSIYHNNPNTLSSNNAYVCSTPAYEEPKIDINLITSSRKYDVGIISRTLRSHPTSSLSSNRSYSRSQPVSASVRPISTSIATINNNNISDQTVISTPIIPTSVPLPNQTTTNHGSTTTKKQKAIPNPIPNTRIATPAFVPATEPSVIYEEIRLPASGVTIPSAATNILTQPSLVASTDIHDQLFNPSSRHDSDSDSGLSRLSSIASAAVTETSDNEMKAYRLTMRMPRSIEEETSERLKLMRENYLGGGLRNNNYNNNTTHHSMNNTNIRKSTAQTNGLYNNKPSSALLPKGNSINTLLNRRKLSYLTDDDETDNNSTDNDHPLSHTQSHDDNQEEEDDDDEQENNNDKYNQSNPNNLSYNHHNNLSHTVIPTVPILPTTSSISFSDTNWNYFANRYNQIITNPSNSNLPLSSSSSSNTAITNSISTDVNPNLLPITSQHITQLMEGYNNVQSLLTSINQQTQHLSALEEQARIQELLQQTAIPNIVTETNTVPNEEKQSITSSVVSSIEHQEDEEDQQQLLISSSNPEEATTAPHPVEKEPHSSSSKVPFRVVPVKRGPRPGDFGELVPPPPLPPVHFRRNSGKYSVDSRTKDHPDSKQTSISHNNTSSTVPPSLNESLASINGPSYPREIPAVNNQSISTTAVSHRSVETVSPVKPVSYRTNNPGTNENTYPISGNLYSRPPPSNSFPSSLNTTSHSLSSTEWITLQPTVESKTVPTNISYQKVSSSTIDNAYASPVKYRTPNLQLPLDLSQDLVDSIPILRNPTIMDTEINPLNHNTVPQETPTKQIQAKIISMVEALPDKSLTNAITNTTNEIGKTNYNEGTTVERVSSVVSTLALPISPSKANEILRETKEKVLRMLSGASAPSVSYNLNGIENNFVPNINVPLNGFSNTNYTNSLPSNPLTSGPTYFPPSNILSTTQYLNSSFVSVPSTAPLNNTITKVAPVVPSPSYTASPFINVAPPLPPIIPSSSLLHSNILQCLHLLPSRDDIHRIEYQLQQDAKYTDLFTNDINISKDTVSNHINITAPTPSPSEASVIHNTSQEIAKLVNQTLTAQAKVRATMESLGITSVSNVPTTTMSVETTSPVPALLNTSYSSIRTHDRERDARLLRSDTIPVNNTNSNKDNNNDKNWKKLSKNEQINTTPIRPVRTTHQVVSPTHSKIERISQSSNSSKVNKPRNTEVTDKELIHPPVPTRKQNNITSTNTSPLRSDNHSITNSSINNNHKKPWHGPRYNTWQPSRWEPTFESQGPLKHTKADAEILTKKQKNSKQASSASSSAISRSSLPSGSRKTSIDDYSSIGSATQILLSKDYIQIGGYSYHHQHYHHHQQPNNNEESEATHSIVDDSFTFSDDDDQ